MPLEQINENEKYCNLIGQNSKSLILQARNNIFATVMGRRSSSGCEQDSCKTSSLIARTVLKRIENRETDRHSSLHI